MTLYIANRTCSLAAQILAHEINLPLAIRHVNVLNHLYKPLEEQTYDQSNDFYAINPQGYVPFLVLENGLTLRETVAVTTYLADLKPELQLLPPAGSIERYKVLELQTFIATELHQKFIPVFREYVNEDAKNKFREILIKNFAELDARFADGRKYLFGDTFTAADAYLFAVAPWTERTHVNISHLKGLWAYMDRVAARPAVQLALKDEKEAAATLSN